MAVVAIHPDDATADPSRPDASSPHWAAALEAAGHAVRWVDARDPGILSRVAGCDGFMWRFGHWGGEPRVARRLLPVLEDELGLCVYPDRRTAWHFDDKIAQWHILNTHRVPTPETRVFFDRDRAHAWAETAAYPVVLKLATGAGSRNVRLVRSPAEAAWWINRLFWKRVSSLDELDRPGPAWPLRSRVTAAWRLLRDGRLPLANADGFEAQTGYALFQEFLPGNAWDTRVTVIGGRAFAFRRMNGDGDFRASGSGKLDWDPSAIDPAFVRLAFETAARLGSASCAIDGLYRGGEPVVAEISYAYASWAVHACPGHWAAHRGGVRWVGGPMRPEAAQIEGFLRRLERRRARAA